MLWLHGWGRTKIEAGSGRKGGAVSIYILIYVVSICQSIYLPVFRPPFFLGRQVSQAVCARDLPHIPHTLSPSCPLPRWSSVPTHCPFTPPSPDMGAVTVDTRSVPLLSTHVVAMTVPLCPPLISTTFSSGYIDTFQLQ